VRDDNNELRDVIALRNTLDRWSWYEELAGKSDDLAAERDVIGNPDRCIVFLGVLNAGKSSLIDCLLGQPLLPVGRFPKTGAVCVIKHGDKESVCVRRQGRVESMLLDGTALDGLMGLTLGGLRVDEDRLPDTIWVTSPRIVLPDDWRFVDTPGQNDSPKMQERALLAAQCADAIVWVANSNAFLSHRETEALAEIKARRGLDGLVIAVNVFLGRDDQAEFEERVEADRDRYIDRLAHVCGQLDIDPQSIPLVFVAARAAGKSAEGFGTADLRAMLAENPERGCKLKPSKFLRPGGFNKLG
jgi:hypothetical protein